MSGGEGVWDEVGWGSGEVPQPDQHWLIPYSQGHCAGITHHSQLPSLPTFTPCSCQSLDFHPSARHVLSSGPKPLSSSQGLVGKAQPCQGQASPSSAPCGVWDISVAATFARSGPLSPARDSARGCPWLVGPCVATALGEGACPGQRGCRALMGSMTCSPSTSELPCAVLQGLSGDMPGVTHGAGFPQPALKHQLHHLTGGVLGKSEDAVLSVCWEGQREGHGAAEQSPEEAPG